jgi:hypothetical protein
MSNSDSRKKTVQLIARADEGTEIFVIDGGFRRVATAIGHMETDLLPGLYTVKFKRGSALAQVDADLFPGSGPVRVQAPGETLKFTSAAPMEQTLTSHEYHQAAAADMSRKTPQRVGPGKGSRLFLFVRDIGVDGIGNPAENMTLHDLRGRKVADFAALGETQYGHDRASAAWYGCHLELSPGFYRLRAPGGDRPGLEQALVLASDWQLQVFVVRRQKTGSDVQHPGETVDLAAGTLFMARPGLGFNPGDPSVQFTELARQGLTSGRIPVTGNDLMQMFAGKFENPMLGLFGAHLLMPLLAGGSQPRLIRPSDPEILKENRAIQLVLGIAADGMLGPETHQRLRQLLDEVTRNLERMLGNHPDVYALRKALAGDQRQASSFQESIMPPMLRRSWDTLMRMDPRYAHAKAGSFAERIADRLWGGGPWLVWRVPPAAARPSGVGRERFGQIFSHAAAIADDTEKLDHLLEKAGLNAVQESIVRNSLKEAASLSQKTPAGLASFETGSVPLEMAARETAKHLGFPVMTVKRNLASAMARIGAAAKPAVLSGR